MEERNRIFTTFACLLAILCIYSEAKAHQTPEEQAQQILNATVVKGGLIVHIGCGDGKLTAALCANDSYVVQGLDADAKNVEKAREYISSLGIYGRVSADKLSGNQLPYIDNLVNLIVAEDLGSVSMDEVMRILCPNGVAYVKTSAGWKKTVKPWPKEIDEWKHFLHDASNNAVARDTQVGPPRRLKWVCSPLWARSHEFNSSLCAMVSAKGRLFYIFDEGQTGITTKSLPERWILTARDAFNGILLWKRTMPKWGSGQWNNRALRSVPATVPRRLVAQADRVFVTLGYDAPISVLDAATGEILATFEATKGTEEIRCLDDILILRKGGNLVMAIDTKTAKLLWEATGKIQPLTLAAQDGRVFYQEGQQLLCLRLRDGKQMWAVPANSPASLIVVHDDSVFVSNKQGLQAVSVETGRSIWAVNARLGRRELFVANRKLWHWEGNRIVGRDLETGKVTTRLHTDDVFTPGHHPRCYQSKATEMFIITPERGVEFVSVTGAPHTQNDWTRGPCRYGIMPCNGLLYVPPNPCFCYPGVKVSGFNAFAPAPDNGDVVRGLSQGERLERASAYKQAKKLAQSGQAGADDWPTYRHDARRTGATACEISPQVSKLWQARLPGPITPPVVSANRVYVAAKDRHMLHALDIENGHKLWQYTAAGRIDSPPTVHGQLVLFGCADGRVYCLRVSDGELLWRFRAAPSDQRIIAFGQLESPWRVHGSILVKDGIAYCTAGRSTYLDGGIFIFALDPGTGKVVHEARVDTWARTREDSKGKPFIPGYHMEGTHSDILVSEGDYIYLGQVKFDRKLVRQEVPYVMPGPDDKTSAMGLAELMDRPFVQNIETMEKDEKVQRDWQLRVWPEMAKEFREKYGGSNLGDRKIGRHVFSTAGFLDDSWFNRTFWMYSATWPGFYIANRAAKTGQLLVVGPRKTYAVQAYPSRNLQSPLFTPGEKGYLLFADDNDNEPVLPDYTRGVPKGIGFTRTDPPLWHKWMPVRIRSMVLASKHLFVAGPPDVVVPKDPMAAFEGRSGGLLWALSTADGKKLAQYELDSPPVFDGMAAASGRLFLATLDGKIVCFGSK